MARTPPPRKTDHIKPAAAPRKRTLNQETKHQLAALGYKKLSDVKSGSGAQVRWLWPGFIPRGALIGIEGDPGNGKSMIAADFFARVSAGLPFPGEEKGRPPMNGLYITNEDPEEIIKARIAASGGNPANVAVLTGAPEFPGHIQVIEDLIITDNIGLVVIDPFEKYTSENLYHPRGARAVVDPLANMARRTNCSIIIVRHLRKGATKNLLQAGTGSIAVAGGVRAGFILGRDSERQAKRLLHNHKMSHGPEQDTLVFHIAEDGHAVWDAEKMNRDESQARLTKSAMDKDERTEREEAVEFLKDYLDENGGIAVVGDILKAGGKAGHSKYILKRYAKGKLKLKALKIGSEWFWVPPDYVRRRLAAM